MRKLISGVLMLVLVVGSVAGIYSAHYCLSVKHLNTKGLTSNSPNVCADEKESCCKENTPEKNEFCCLNSDELNSFIDKQFTSSALIILDQHPTCCVKVSGFFGIPVFKTAVQNFAGYLLLFPKLDKERLFLNVDTQLFLAQNIFQPPGSERYHQYQSFLQVFKI